MDLLGSSIEDLFNKFLRNFTAKTILMIGMQMVNLNIYLLLNFNVFLVENYLFF